MKREDVVKDFNPYWNQYNSLNIYSKNNPEQDNGNALGYSAHYYSILSRNNLVEQSDKDKFKNMISVYWKTPGLLNRKPNDEWCQAFDDYEFVCHAAHMIGETQVPEQIYQYGKNNFWYFNNTSDKTFRLKYFFNRRPGFTTHVKLCAGRTPNILERLFWAVGIALFGANSDVTNTSGKVREFMYILNYEKSGIKSWVMDLAVKHWRNKMSKMYPNKQMGEVLDIYFSQLPFISKYYEGAI